MKTASLLPFIPVLSQLNPDKHSRYRYRFRRGVNEIFAPLGCYAA